MNWPRVRAGRCPSLPYGCAPVAMRVDDDRGEPWLGNALVDSPNREAHRADQAVASVPLKDDMEERLVVRSRRARYSSSSNTTSSVRSVAADIASELAVRAGPWSFVSERGERR